jgi:hypothetical protein
LLGVGFTKKHLKVKKNESKLFFHRRNY